MGLLSHIFKPISRDRFAGKMLRYFEQHGCKGKVRYDAADFRIIVSTDGDQSLYLNNAYDEYCAAKWRDRARVIEHFAALGLKPAMHDSDFSKASANLLPRVRERFYHENLRLHLKQPKAGEKPLALPTRLLNEDLTLELVYDHPESVQVVSDQMLGEWKINFDEGLTIAKDNLWKISNESFNLIMPGLYVSPWSDTHDASRMYLHDLVWQLQVKGRHVAMIPNRTILLVAGSEDMDALAKMGELAMEVLHQPRPSTGIAFVLEGTAWVPFLPPAESAAYWPMKKAAMFSKSADYRDQQATLNAIHEQTGEDIFVASQTVMARKDGTWYTWTSWIDGVTDALIPEAEVVFFGKSEGPGNVQSYGKGEWQRVAEVIGHLMEPTEYYPKRYRIRAFPTQEQLAQLALTPFDSGQ